MDWTEFFKLTVLRETLQGPHRYFHSELKIPLHFSRDELSPDEFNHLDLSEQERMAFSVTLRKLYLRHRFFRTPEFERITGNFSHRISQEKEQLLTFSTYGGGVYLFINLLKLNPDFLKEKRLICYTSEPPLQLLSLSELRTDKIYFILHPHRRSYFRNFPSLWDKSGLIDLYALSEAQ